MKNAVDIRSNEFVFLPFCAFCQAFQAQGISKKYSSVISELYDYLGRKNYNLVQMPCPESSFKNFSNLKREPHGLKFYNTEEYNLHCQQLAQQTFIMISIIIKSGYSIKCILGIENSPTCTVKTLYTNKVTIKMEGLFISKLNKLLQNAKISIPIIPIYRKNIQKTINMLENL